MIVIATGSEVSLALDARETLQAQGIPTRVVSMPCREWFMEQGDEYRREILPPNVRARVSIEAASVFGWSDLVGDAGRSVGIDHFGASADAKTLFEKFGITAKAVVDKAHESLAAVAADAGPIAPGSPAEQTEHSDPAPGEAVDPAAENEADSSPTNTAHNPGGN